MMKTSNNETTIDDAEDLNIQIKGEDVRTPYSFKKNTTVAKPLNSEFDVGLHVIVMVSYVVDVGKGPNMVYSEPTETLLTPIPCKSENSVAN